MGKILAAVAVVACLGMAGCSQTSVVQEWRAYDQNLIPQPMLVNMAANSESVRRSFEEQLSKRFRESRVQADPSYEFVASGSSVPDLRTIAGERGYQSLLVTRFLSQEQSLQVIPPAPGPPWAGGWYRYPSLFWNEYWEPPIVVSETFIYRETSLIRLSDERIMWSLLTRTRVSGTRDSVIADLAKTIGNELMGEAAGSPASE